ncbi:sensor histidine kinase [Vulgatibacter sp.]|uniref:sensor histidine kinase n=1 Tax=Vulgatibacter sp. TaxID=1971226 RepID=UPI00356A504F
MEVGQRQSEVALLVRARRERILARWLARLRTTRWARLPDAALIDHQPKVLDAVVTVLESGQSDFRRLEEPARAHAENRHAIGYELAELLLETSWFRTILVDEVLAAGGELPLEERELLHQALDQTQVLSALVFSERRDERMRQLREEAEDARLQYEEALAAMTDGYFRLDSDFRFIFINPAGERMLGLRHEEARGRLLWEAIPGSADTEIGRRYRAAMESQQPFEITTRFEPWDRFFEVRSFPGPRGLSIYFRDITERLEKDRERARTLEALERGDAVFITDADARIVYVNATQERLAQRPREESLGQILWEAYANEAKPGSRYWTEYHRVLEEGAEVAFDEYYAPTGIWTGVTAYPTREGGMVAFFRDVTRRKEVEELQERIIGVVGHDLRNPLSTILLGVHRVASLEELPERARPVLARIQRSAERMERMIAALLDYTRAEYGGGIPVECAPGDLAEVLEGIGEEFSVSHPERVVVTTDGNLAGCWDADRLAQALSNLVGNALRHGAPNCPVTVRATSEADGVTLTVHNTGAPIPAEERGRLFRPFARGSSDSAGLGLGLYITRNIVEQHGGTIDLHSEEGEGTTFTISLPRR